MQHSQTATTMIEGFEGLRLTAYQDQGGVWTVGFGHTGPEVVEGLTITLDQANGLMNADITKFDDYLNKVVTVPLNQNQFDALISLTYNIGDGHFQSSTVLRKLLLEDYSGAADAFLMWNKIAGNVSVGLTRRREAEKALFLTPVEPVIPVTPDVSATS
jgi:lysozyme